MRGGNVEIITNRQMDNADLIYFALFILEEMNADVEIRSIHITQPEQTGGGIGPEEQIAGPDGKAEAGAPVTIIYNGKGEACFEPFAFVPRCNRIHIRLNNTLPMAMTKAFGDRDIDKVVVVTVPIGLCADGCRQSHLERIIYM